MRRYKRVPVAQPQEFGAQGGDGASKEIGVGISWRRWREVGGTQETGIKAGPGRTARRGKPTGRALA